MHSWGTGSQGQLGHGNDQTEMLPRVIEALNGLNVHCVAAGEAHCLCATADHDLYSWGSGKVSHHLIFSSDYLVLTLSHFVSQDGRLGHGLILTQSYGSVCYTEPFKESTPRAVLALAGRTRQVSAGAAHSAAITCDKQVYTWGAGEQGRLGHNSQDVEFEPRAVRQFELDAVEVTQVLLQAQAVVHAKHVV